MAKALAGKLGYTYIDSGAMYRAVTLYCLQEGLINDGVIDEEALKRRLPRISVTFESAENGHTVTCLNGINVERDIRSLDVSGSVSKVSALPFVREAMVLLQRKAGESGGVVMDGRDIGTVVFPNAEVKIFVTADAEVRARRRFDELKEKGMDASFESILENIRQRDDMDRNRAVSPLRKASDAVELDNGHMSIEEQDAWLMNVVNKKSAWHTLK